MKEKRYGENTITTSVNVTQMTFVLVTINGQAHRVFFGDDRERDNFMTAMRTLVGITVTEVE